MTSTLANVFLHGFTVKPHMPLVALESESPVDVVTTGESGNQLIDDAMPTIAVSVSVSEDDQDRVLMRLVGTHPKFFVEWPGLMSASIDHLQTHTSLRFALPPSVPPGFESLLLSPAIGALATLNGNLVLHGSTVEIDGDATVLLAEAGGGKSTVTALLCHAGAHIISEDVSVLSNVAKDATQVFSGIHELRLRDTNTWLAELAGLRQSEPHPDGRITLRPIATVRTSSQVKTIAIVHLDRNVQKVEITPVSPIRSVASMMMFQRTTVQSTHPLARQMFDEAVRASSNTRMVVLTIPWAESKRTAQLADEILECLRTI